MPQVSVIMPVYNQKPEYLREAIESILQQTFKDFELIIVDDGSESYVYEILKEYAACDARVVVVRNEVNCGLVYSCNRGIDLSRGPYIARMDSDDVSMRDRLAMQLSTIVDQSLDFVLSNYVLIDSEGREIRKVDHEVPLFPSYGIVKRYFILHSSFMGKKEVFVDLKYDERYKAAQDFDFMLRLVGSRKYTISKVDQYLVQYRITDNCISIVNWKTSERDMLQIKYNALMKYEFPFFLSFFTFTKALLYYIVPSWVKIKYVQKVRHSSK